jgi:hypothetical protein
MESKGKRVARAARPSATPVGVLSPADTSPEAAKPVESPAAEFTPAEPSPEVLVPAAAAMPAPSAEIPAASEKGPSLTELTDFRREAFAALVQSQTAVARGLEALSAEMTDLAISGIDVARRTATNMLGVKTIFDAIEINAGFTRTSFDALVGGSAKLSELGVKLATEASQPLLAQLGKSWIKAASFALQPTRPWPETRGSDGR